LSVLLSFGCEGYGVGGVKLVMKEVRSSNLSGSFFKL